MANVIINDVQPNIQFVALQDQTVFTFPFVVFEASDLQVFLTPVGQVASDGADILQLGIDYVVNGLKETDGGNVVLTNPTNAGDFITILRNSPISRETNFVPGNFSEEQMNDALNSQVTFSQDNEMLQDKLVPQYQKSAFFLPGQLVLPKLGPDEIWKATANGDGLIAVKFSQTNCDTLRQDLAVEAEFSDGARLVGYFDNRIGGLGLTTVNLALDAALNIQEPVSATNNIILGGDFSTNPFQEGINFSDTDIGVERYIADGWALTLGGGGGTMRASSLKDIIFPVPVSLSNIFSDASLKVTSVITQAVINAANRFLITQPIEGNYFREVAQRISFVTFYARSSLTGVYTFSLVNTGGDQSFVKEFTIGVANTWQKIIIEVPSSPVAGIWDYNNGRAVLFSICLAAGSDSFGTDGVWQAGNKVATSNQVNFFASATNTFNFNLVQIEPVKNTPYQKQQFTEEMAFAQRYFEKSYSQNIIPGVVTTEGQTLAVVHAGAPPDYQNLRSAFRTEKRILPIVKWFSPFTGTIDRVRDLSFNVDLAIVNTLGAGTGSTGNPIGAIALGSANDVSAQYTANARMTL